MSKTLTFIGNGAMALSLAQGLKKEYAIEVVGRSRKNLDTFEASLQITIAKAALEGFDISGKTLILCVKPANISHMRTLLRGHAASLYSVLAGTSLKTLQHHIDADAYIRAMPNLAATLGKSMTTLTGETCRREEACALFASIGSTLWLDSEKELDIATALAGSGPAYLALVAEALTDGAVKQGLKRDDAMTLMRGLFEGFGSLIQQQHPALLKDRVMSPGGTTAAGYAALEKAAVRQGCMAAIEQAYSQAKLLS